MTTASALPTDTQTEVLFSAFDSGWGRELPVSLLTYKTGEQDLHRQTGSDFEAHVERARLLLRERGLQVGEVSFIGPTGAYMAITALEQAVA